MALQFLRRCNTGGSSLHRFHVISLCRSTNSFIKTASVSSAFQRQSASVQLRTPWMDYSMKPKDLPRAQTFADCTSTVLTDGVSSFSFGHRQFPISQGSYVSPIASTTSVHRSRWRHCHVSQDTSRYVPRILISTSPLQGMGIYSAVPSWYVTQGRQIHTSPSKHAPPIALVMALKSLGKAAAVLTGRTLRNHWRSHPKHKHKSTRERLHENKGKILAGLMGLLGFGIGFYFYHIDYTPLTNRQRFIMFNATQFKKIVDAEYEMHLKEYEASFVPVTHPIYKVISDIIGQLIRGNQDVAQIRNQSWTIHVVDKNLKNAFVLPNGHIFVFTGILQATENTEQLGAVLAHEMAHVVLNHSAEMSSFFEFFDFFMIVILTALWAFLPNDGIALVATWFKNRVIQLLLHMPYNRSLETEADEVGLMLAAKSCFDVRECKAFWEAMDAAQTAAGEPDPIEFLSTHPSHQTRAENIEAILPRALRVREYCECPALRTRTQSKPRPNSGKAVTSAIVAA